MIDRDFEQVSEEHMKSTTKPEGPAQEPHERYRLTCPRGHSRSFTQYGLGIYDCHDCGDYKFVVMNGTPEWCDEQVPKHWIVPATPAPSQPAGAREWLERYHGDLSRLEWPQQFPLSVLIEYLEAYAAQQTAAKDAELAWLRKERQRHLVELEAAERERDSLREALEQIAQVAASDGHIKLLSVWRIADAALKAGKK